MTSNACAVVLEYKEPDSRGRKSNLSLENQLLLTLSFWREYRTLLHLGREWKLHESNVSRLVRRIEDILIKSGKFALPGKKQLLADDAVKYTIFDVTEREIERPKKNSADFIRAKKAALFKAQIIIDEENEQIIATFFGKGKTHDYNLFQTSGGRLGRGLKSRADPGYWGLQTESSQAILPSKNSKLHPLTKAEKKLNQELARRRVKVKNVTRRLKVFRILSERYRHRRKRFGLRFNLIAGLHNYELKLKS